ncbi:MAG: carboxypeptidase regulatory-like domain-containing protein [Synergistaceae bacterium]|nr:carboxypeptidase regulatory-like domain-containing protein [Synergistaceae bacterium]
MSNRKFFVFMSIFFLLCLAAFTGGCGGGGGGSSHPSAVEPSPDITVPTSPDTPAPSGYTVSFNSNGGSEIPSVTVSKNSTINQPEDPVKDSCLFAGWYKDNETFADPFAFGDDGEKVTGNITLYAQWFDDDPAGFAVDYSLAMIEIAYSDGDNPDYVTQNLGLPSSSEGLPITWTSTNSAAIAPNGAVTRPAGSNTRVILTASAVSGDFRAAKSFDLTVIRARSLTPEQAKIVIAPVDVADIEAMNYSNDAFEMDYSESSDVVRAIEGRFTNITVGNADDALDAVQSVHGMLGIDDPYEESELFSVARDEYGAQYSFRQVYPHADTHEKIPVYGRVLMVSANASGDTDFLTSNFSPTDSMNDVYTQYTKDIAESAALRHYAGSNSTVDVVSSDTRKIIYSLGDYELEPVMAFEVRVRGNTSSGDVIDENVIVSGHDLSIIAVDENIRTWKKNDTARDELGVLQTFPVTYDLLLRKNMRDSGHPEVRIYNGNLDTPVRTIFSGSFRDGQQISAYTNMRRVINWWRVTFGRNSLNNKGMTVKVVTHDTSTRDNAYWSSQSEYIAICNLYNSNKYEFSRAIGLDTLTHETTHAVMYYSTGGIPYKNATGAIDDGYADIFGCLRDRDWQHGWRVDPNSTDPEKGITYFVDKTQCLRDAREAITVNSLSQNDNNDGTLDDINDLYDMYKTVAPARVNDNNGCHTYCRLVTHAAYLMHQDGAESDGLTWVELGRVWYKSFTMGYDATSDFHTVRRNILRSAQQLRLSDAKIRTIKKAFDKIGVYGRRGTIKGRVTDYMNGGTLSVGTASVIIRGSAGQIETRISTVSADGRFSVNVETGHHTVTVYPNAGSYRTYQTRVSLVNDKDSVNINAALVRTGTGSIDVYVRDAKTGNYLSGVTVRVVNNWTQATEQGTTNSSGRYTFRGIPSGYYTVRTYRTGYNGGEFSVTLPPSRTITLNGAVYPESRERYIVLLETEESNFNDFSAHLKANIDGQAEFLLDSDNDTVYVNGKESAHHYGLPVVSTHWIDFINYSRSEYVYYVKRENSSVEWGYPRVRVRLYYKNNAFVSEYILLDSETQGDYWEVFRIRNNGYRKKVNAIREEEPDL